MDNGLAGFRDKEVESHSSHSLEDSPVCWICLDGATQDEPLVQPCGCPRHCHAQCIARWQLQSAGSRKETHCDFCSKLLPDWKPVLTPAVGVAAPAVMNVNFGGKTYSFEVEPGDEGYQLFTGAIRKAFSLPGDSELNITFTCDDPISGALLTLQGSKSYDAAVYCASISAAKRLHKPDFDVQGTSLRDPTARSASSRHSTDCTPTREQTTLPPTNALSAPSSPMAGSTEQQRGLDSSLGTGTSTSLHRAISIPPTRRRPASPVPRNGFLDLSRPPPGLRQSSAHNSSSGGARSTAAAPVADAPSAAAQSVSGAAAQGNEGSSRKGAGSWAKKLKAAVAELFAKLHEPPVHRSGAGAGGAARF